MSEGELICLRESVRLSAFVRERGCMCLREIGERVLETVPANMNIV